MVLSDLLARTGDRSGELAKIDDRARIEGELRETFYNALTK